MVLSNKKKRTESELLIEKFLELSRKQSLGVEYQELAASLEERLEVLSEENRRLSQDLVLDSEYIAKLQQELKKEKEGKESSAPDRKEKGTLLEKEMRESRLHASQLEKGIQYLRCKLEEANTDKEILGEEVVHLREEIEALRSQLSEARSREENATPASCLEKKEERLHSLEQGVLKTIQEVKECSREMEDWAESEEGADKKQRELQNVRHQLEFEQREKEQLKEKLRETEQQVVELEKRWLQGKANETDALHLQEKYKELEKHLQDVLQKGEEAAKHRVELEQKVKRLEEKKKHHEAQNLPGRLESEEEKARQLEESLETAERQFSKKIEGFTLLFEQKETLTQEVETLKQESGIAQRRIFELRSKLQKRLDIEHSVREQLSLAGKTIGDMRKQLTFKEMKEKYDKLVNCINKLTDIFERENSQE